MAGRGIRNPGGSWGQGSKWCHPPTRRRIYERDGWRCVWCQCRVRSGRCAIDRRELATLDHVVPVLCGGSHRPTNLVTACMSCNTARGKVAAVIFAFSGLGQRYPRSGRTRPSTVLDRVINALDKELPP